MNDDANAQQATAPRRWIGIVPSHWQVAQLKLVARLESGHTPSRQVREYWENCTIPWFSLADVWQLREQGRKYVYETAEMVSELGIANSSARVLPSGTVMLSRTASVGFTGIMGREMATTQDFVNWVCGPRLKPDYLWYCLQAMRPEFERLRLGSTHQTIYMPDVAQFKVPVPPVREQERIANFLDEQTARIDALIAEKEALLRRLEELRLSTIYACLTSGFDNAECRPTNDEWFPTVPSHWNFCALNYRYEVQLGKMLDEKRQTGMNSIPYLRNVDVRWDRIDTNDLPSIDIAPDERERYTVNAGDLLICEGGVGVGRTALWTSQDGVVAYQKALHRLRPRGRSDIPRYVLYLMRDAVARGRVLGAEKATIPHLTAESFRRWRFPFPPEQEQRRIVETLDGVSKHCDRLGEHCGEHIDRLREYRSSLISAAVTGQLDISTFDLKGAAKAPSLAKQPTQFTRTRSPGDALPRGSVELAERESALKSPRVTNKYFVKNKNVA